MRCPNCGAENPDIARYCGFCSTMLRDESASTLDEAPGPRSILDTVPPRTGRMNAGSPSTRASLTLTVSLILISLGFAAQVIYYERFVFDRGGYFENYYDLMKAMFYLSELGNLTAVLGMVFILQALMALRGGPGTLSRILRERFAPIKWMLILSAVLFGIGLIFFAMVSDLRVEMSYKIAMRLYYYSPNLAWVIADAALLLFSFSLREAERSNR
jgi:zinc-ribbon domain